MPSTTTRTVMRPGIHYLLRWYWSPRLDRHYGEKVIVVSRTVGDGTIRVMLMDGTYIDCKAVPQDPLPTPTMNPARPTAGGDA